MKNHKSYLDDRGIAMVVELVLVAIVLAAIGYGFYVYHTNMTSKSPAASKSPTPTSSTSASSATSADASCVATYHDANLCHFASNSTSLDKMAYKANITETASGQTTTLVLEIDGKGDTSLSGTGGGAQLNSIELAGATYVESGSTWIKYPASSATTPTTSNPTSSMNIGVGAAGISYKEIDTESCGSLTCFKYQVTDSASPGTTQYAWFDNQSFLLRQWKYTDASGNSTDMNLSYEPITITAPSPVTILPTGQ